MFFLHNLERQVTLHPSYFGKNMRDLVTQKLLSDVEGTCTGQYYIISVMDTFDVSEGRIIPGSGLAEFTVRYRAVVWRPFKNETVRIPAMIGTWARRVHQWARKLIILRLMLLSLLSTTLVSIARQDRWISLSRER